MVAGASSQPDAKPDSESDSEHEETACICFARSEPTSSLLEKRPKDEDASELARNRERGSSFLSEITFEPVNGSTFANLPLRALIGGAEPASLSEIGAAK